MREKVIRCVVGVSRLALALTFIVSGFAKLNDPTGTGLKLNEYIVAFGLDTAQPHPTISLLAAAALGVFEFMLGILTFFAANRRSTTTLLVLFMTAMTALSAYLAVFDPVSDCGCFGTLIRLTNWQTFGKNIVLLACSVALAVWWDRMRRIVSERGQWMIRLYGLVYAIMLGLVSIIHLPYIDTMDYRIGERIGETDGTMAFVALDRQSGEDMTDKLLADGYTLLIISDNLAEANDGEMDRLNLLRTYTSRNGMRMAMVTATEDDEVVERWQEMTGAEYPILWGEETTLRTMIRSNPGMILLRDGRVTGKWSHYDIPELTFESLDLPPEVQPWTDDSQESDGMKALRLILWFCVPLTLWTILDYLYKLFKTKTKNYEKENRSRQLEDEHEPAGRRGPGH